MAKKPTRREDRPAAPGRVLLVIALLAVFMFLAGAFVASGVSGSLTAYATDDDPVTDASGEADQGFTEILYDEPAQAAEDVAADEEAVANQDDSGSTYMTVAMIGDVLMHTYCVDSGAQADGTYNFDHIFANITDELSPFDVRVVNQETVLGGTELGLSDFPQFNSPQEIGDAEAEAGFNVVLCASNHSMDVGYEGLHRELEFWATNHPEVSTIGATDVLSDDPQPANPCYVTVDDFTVAFLNFTDSTNGIEDPYGAVARLWEQTVLEQVAGAKANADMVVVFPHWGEENLLEPTDRQRYLAQLLLDAGVDVVIGAHSHTLEPVEVLTGADGHQMVCYWSVGNFISAMETSENMVGGMAELTLRKDADGTCVVESYALKPVVTHWGSGDAMTTYLLSDYTSALAASNGHANMGVDWVQAHCASVLGEDYNRADCQLYVELNPPAQDE